MTEPATGAVFPPASADGTLKLAGCGVRVKYYVAKVYAVGVYVPPSFRLPPGATEPLTAVRAAVASRGADVELRMVMAREVTKHKFVESLDEQIQPRTSRAQSEAFKAAWLAGFEDVVKNGAAFVLRLKPDGKVIIVDSGGAELVNLVVPEVADALLDVYLGPDAVSPTARDSVLAGLKAFGA